MCLLFGSMETVRAQHNGWPMARAIGREERSRSMVMGSPVNADAQHEYLGDVQETACGCVDDFSAQAMTR